MRHSETYSSSMTWIWSDREIERPRYVKSVIEKACSRGIHTIRIFLENCSYRFTDKPVIRAVSRTSQWARGRDMDFWLHLDPRQASRLFISAVDEQQEFLLAHASAGRSGCSLTRVVNGTYTLEYDWKIALGSSVLQEKGLSLEADCLERVFLFRLQDNVIVNSTVFDISNDAMICFDMKTLRCRVFGTIRVPDEQDWYVTAFPKFRSNLFDYFGRESNDLLAGFVEDLFDGCTHIDGFSWGEGGPLSITDPGLFPVSLSLYNSFRAEFGYDLRDRLYCLTLPVDNNQHVKIRRDYYTFLQQAVMDARKDFHRLLHAFFGDIKESYYFPVTRKKSGSSLHAGDIDPWRKAAGTARVFAVSEASEADSRFLAEMVLARSVGLVTESHEACLSMTGSPVNRDSLIHMHCLMTALGLKSSPAVRGADSLPDPELNGGTLPDQLRSLLPLTDTLVIYPTETLISMEPAAAEQMHQDLMAFFAALTLRGVQFDILNSISMYPFSHTDELLTIRGRSYRRIIYPFPRVVAPALLDLILSCCSAGLPVYLGGRPEFMTDGTEPSGRLRAAFDPADPLTLPAEAAAPLFGLPDGAVGSCLKTADAHYFVLAPAVKNSTYSGTLKNSITVPERSGLSVFRLAADGSCTEVL